MNYSRIVKLLLFCLLSPFFSAVSLAARPSASAELQLKLQAPVRGYHLRATNFVEGLTQVASHFQIPIGIMWVKSDSATKKLDLSWKSANVQQVIEAIAKSRPGYTVRIAGDIVHVFSSKFVPEKQNFLTLRVRSFAIKDQVVEMGSRRLRDLLKLTVSPPMPRSGPGGIGTSTGARADEPKISVELRDVTVRDALDALVAASARKIWIVTFSDDPTLTPTGFRRTLTLWNNFPIPDNEQPVWDLLHWGDTPPLLAKN